MEKLIYKIQIAASKQKVWDTMLSLSTYEQWTAIAWPNSTFIGTWEKGNFIKFVSKGRSGTLAEIVDCKKYKSINATHIALLLPGGIEDRASGATKNWIGIKENYFFEEIVNHTELTIQMETHPMWLKMFNDTWPIALQTLKNICEH